MKTVLFQLMVFSLVCAMHASASDPKKNYAVIKPTDSKADIVRKAANVVPSPQQYAWQKMEFTAFVHFGMDTFTESQLGTGKESPELFLPTDFDCDQWARTFKEAGMKLAILTAKHHDGFCLWPSKYTKHSVEYSRWKNGKGDVVREFVEACRKYGLKIGLYLSPWDRNNTSYGTPAYNRYFMNQLRELLTNYGAIDEVWFDGYKGPEAKDENYDFHSFYRLIRELQPNAVIAISGPDVRWVGTESGYGRDTEWDVLPIDLSKLDEQELRRDKDPADDVFVPSNYMGDDLGSREKLYAAKGLFWYPAETDVSIRPGWFYTASQDTEVKSVGELIDIYFSSVGKNSVLLLNVPPDKRGLITDYDRDTLLTFHKIIDSTFNRNFARDAKVKIDNRLNEVTASSLFGSGKYWLADEHADSSSIEFLLPGEESFDVAMLQENIQIGQRIEQFHIDYWDGHSWQELTKGTTAGYKRLMRFTPIRTNRIRLVIEKSRLNPTLSDFGLFKLPEEYLGPHE
jgi:alpha-L-fucosidase